MAASFSTADGQQERSQEPSAAATGFHRASGSATMLEEVRI
jgi:hypothetical protein